MLDKVNNGTIISNNCSFNNYYGILAKDCSNNNITANVLDNNRICGVYLDSCSNFTLTNNNFSRSGICLESWYVFNSPYVSSHKIDKNNYVNGKSIYYYVNQSNLNSNNFTNAGQILLINCNHSIINNQNLNFSTSGILLHSCKNITVSDLTISNNTEYAIKVISSDYINISNIYSLNNTNGIELDHSNYNLIKNNIVSNCNEKGIEIDSSSNFNNLTFNKLYNTRTGFDLSGNNLIIENNTFYLGTNGIVLKSNSGCIILGNNFTDFNENGIDSGDSKRIKIIRNWLFKSSINLRSCVNFSLSYNNFFNSGLKFVYNQKNDSYYNSHSINTTNLVNNRSLYYYVNQSKLSSNDFIDAGQIILLNCNDSIISNQNISDTINGIFLRLSYNTTIFNSTISNCDLGIYMSNSSYSSIISNKLYNVNEGIQLSNNKNTTIGNNSLTLGGGGILLSNSFNNKILSNNLTDFESIGIYSFISEKNEIISNLLYNSSVSLYRSQNETIINNRISNYDRIGIFIWESNWNEITENEFFNNSNGIYLKLSNNNILTKNIIYYINIGVFFESSNLTYVADNVLVGNNLCFGDDDNCYGNIFVNNRCIRSLINQEDDDASEEEEEEDNSILIVGPIIGIVTLAILSGLLSFYHIKKTRYPNLKFFKMFKKIKTSEAILTERDKEDLRKLFRAGGPSDPNSPLRVAELTLISGAFLKRVDKLGLEVNDKVEFLKEMLYFSSIERELFLNDLFKRLKSGKQKRHIFIGSW